MLKKRLIGVVTVKDGWAVQSFGYKRYLPLGRPEVLVENLDRWGADEIFVQCIDRSRRGLGPDFETLERVTKGKLSTPLIYGGGIRSLEDGVKIIQAGADRVCLDAMLHDAPHLPLTLAKQLGAQALIASLPLCTSEGAVNWLDYRDGTQRPLSETVLDLFRSMTISEAMIIDWRHEGTPNGFDAELLSSFPLKDTPLIFFGGLSETDLQETVIASPQAVAIAVGNFLSYREHAIQAYKRCLEQDVLRPAAFGRDTSDVLNA